MVKQDRGSDGTPVTHKLAAHPQLELLVKTGTTKSASLEMSLR